MGVRKTASLSPLYKGNELREVSVWANITEQISDTTRTGIQAFWVFLQHVTQT